MTTKLDLDDEVLAAARELATASGRTLGEVVSDLARKGLGNEEAKRAAMTITRDRGVPVAKLDPSPGVIDLNAVRDELEEAGP